MIIRLFEREALDSFAK